ncbi:MAG: YmdB family metallophosphoesterase [Staphylococcus lugdunensis]|nr:YmdB family metallophosphoesterase [Staphylococcus lugdunensis]
MRILFIGDIVGKVGRKMMTTYLPKIKQAYHPTVSIVNAENAAHGKGLTEKIYKQLLPHCKKLYLTKVHESFEGDTHFPEIDFSKYDIEYSSDKMIDEKNGLTYSFINLVRK